MNRKIFIKNLVTTSLLSSIFETISHFRGKKIIKDKQLFPDPEENFLRKKSWTLEHKHRHMIITQAYRDVGFKGDVFVRFDYNLNYSTFSFFTAQRRAVIVNAPEPFIDRRSDAELYSTAGHEAIHAKHMHLNLKVLLLALTAANCSSPLRSLLLLLLISRGPISQIFEIDSDISSVQKLNTAKVYSNYWLKDALLEDKLDKLKNHSKFWQSCQHLASTHPHSWLRYHYLFPYINDAKPLLFQSKTYKIIEQERYSHKSNFNKM